MTTSVAREPKPSRLASALSGSLSGALVSACVQPLDVIRTRMQADSAQRLAVTTTGTIRKIVGENGIKALWQGTQPTVVRLGVGAGLHFFFLETLKPIFQTNKDGQSSLGIWGAAMTGGLSRAMAAVVSCPITVVKTRMEYIGSQGAPSTVPVYKNTLHALKTIARQEGFRGLYKGLGPTILSNTPFSALYYMFYTRLQSRLQQTDMPQVAVNLSSSTIAAIGATLLTQPADVVRTRMQLNLVSSSPASAQHAKNTFAIMKSIIQSQGFSGLLVGSAPRMIKRTLQTALVWTIYEEISPKLSAGLAAFTLALQRKQA